MMHQKTPHTAGSLPCPQMYHNFSLKNHLLGPKLDPLKKLCNPRKRML